MLIPNHPADERLSGLAFDDPDAASDAKLADHVASCERCTDAVGELRALRTSLAELPDLQPPRPLRLLPEVTEEPLADDLAYGWARRFFAPVLTAGVALAMVGLVGTAMPAFQGMASSAFQNVATELSGDGAPAERASGEVTPAGSSAQEPVASSADTDGSTAPGVMGGEASGNDSGAAEEPGDEEIAIEAGARPIWPMILFAGVALIVAAALMRWILAPRPS
jgi:hypothetical protein